ncbi:MAG: hypothetical protein KKC80_06860 [Candidatus Margulisbacteria bacterium]|nr:hypothetical protein [Candidatus Margulisiibacteriota bacterium]MBU1617525.1 hypothetical protein [Candidatus Margulisiibacteriota bacterium]MBU1867566.1 hypothetical protein [Candidatus Margulisiibacteriota bacterium]
MDNNRVSGNVLISICAALFVVSLLAVPVSAGLLEDVDSLTPQQAVELEKKLEQKRFEAATPENSRISGFVQLVNPAALMSAYPGVRNIGNLYGCAYDLRAPITDKVLIGGTFSGAGNYTYGESAPKVYEDLFLVYGNAQVVMDFRLLKTENFVLSLTPGVGVMLGGFNYSRTDDNTRASYGTNRWGSGFCASLALDATWKVYQDWGFGVGVSSFSGKLANMRKIFSGVDSTAPDIDLAGTTIRISGSKYF